MPIENKLQLLKTSIAKLPSVLIAYSGGVDSTFLLSIANEVLGERAVAVTVKNNAVPAAEYFSAEEFCLRHGIELVTVSNDVFAIDAFRSNAPDRCYHCKAALFKLMKNVAEQRGITHIAEGSNTDDDNDYRPGHRAIAENGIISPLRTAGLSKAEIRELSRLRGLETWDKPAIACLATRFPYGEELTAEKFAAIDASEKYLQDNGVRQVRVRYHGTVARIETDDDGFRIITNEREAVDKALKEIGFKYAAIDLAGYKTGNMNE